MITELKKNIIMIRTVDWNRRLFDELIPLPDGTSYNAYIIKGKEKITLIDSSDIRKVETFMNDLKKIDIDTIDYVIANHAEPDHSGAIPDVLRAYPDAKVVATEKCKDILVDLLHLPSEKFHVVNDGDELDLGGYTLKFIVAPWVHWPETMFTHLLEEKVLFTCDFLGNHIASSTVYSTDDARVYNAAKRYYAEIMMPFRNIIAKHVKRVKEMDLELIATSHGLIYKDPGFIINAYEDWISEQTKNEVVIPYISMYGSTEKMVHYLAEKLIDNGIVVKPFKLTVTDIGELAMALVDATTIVIGSPTVLTGAHPAAIYAAALANLLRPKAKFATVVGSYGWKGKLVDKIVALLPNLKVELLTPVVIKGRPDKNDFKELDRLVDEITAKHRSIGV
ncbi:MAG: FprA family A-type flavoprotein, partial [Promethearchaeota archaeon]